MVKAIKNIYNGGDIYRKWESYYNGSFLLSTIVKRLPVAT